MTNFSTAQAPAARFDRGAWIILILASLAIGTNLATIDAARTLATFSASMRDDVNLNELSQRLQATVVDARQPSHVSLWLKSGP